MSEEVIELKNLKKYFTISKGISTKKIYVKAIDDVNLKINKGEIIGLVGESGSGKTTLARVLLNLTKPTGGSVVFNGVNLTKATRNEMKKLRTEVAVVFQDPASNLNPRDTVMNSIMRPLILHGMPKKTARQKAIDSLELVKMDVRYLNSYPHQLSGGQLQRIAIARALVLNPKVMILDEPTSALDISVQAQILNLLLDLQESFGLTYLVITHDLNVIRYISDRVAVMYLGKIVEFGPTEEVINNPKHPYTEGLMAASPIMDPHDRDKEKYIMQGDPGSLINLPSGCHFHPRCPYASEHCKEESPQIIVLPDGHQVDCHKYAAVKNI
ncbi:Oligopeptide transport ATP-binding protein OppF [bioreactor metagenome]|uniref:Peptide/nickel transport system ATP-binding protein/oligopeptide transport system ATP-binding protein n=2 Tax=root TaxID=1 RepID=A0A562J1G7_9FIRM|nr:ABC transporter ATP-binding protein [Sedimentibacter saalensis]MEA5095515.1 ABC transporter ATP-binding protein [Sedimentibacter saalensis]TWH76987.1 peptide/nickel transport system ATP-binding protein/oligopeptide transport system ATP-binding protein [Sedimentibacter saalensis]